MFSSEEELLSERNLLSERESFSERESLSEREFFPERELPSGRYLLSERDLLLGGWTGGIVKDTSVKIARTCSVALLVRVVVGGGEIDKLGNVDGNVREGDGVDGNDEGDGDDFGGYEVVRDDRDCTMLFSSLPNNLSSFRQLL